MINDFDLEEQVELLYARDKDKYNIGEDELKAILRQILTESAEIYKGTSSTYIINMPEYKKVIEVQKILRHMMEETRDEYNINLIKNDIDPECLILIFVSDSITIEHNNIDDWFTLFKKAQSIHIGAAEDDRIVILFFFENAYKPI